jgi:hypothetical protein
MAKEKRKRGRPPLPLDIRGVQIRHRVLPATRDALVEIAELTGDACGDILDRIVAKEFNRVTGRRSVR